MTGWRRTQGWMLVAGIAAVALPGCGGGARQDAQEPTGNFPVTVTAASFPASQRLAEHTNLVIDVRNSGRRAIPNLAVTICNTTCTTGAPAGQGSNVAAFGSDLNQPGLASSSRPIWIVDRPPGPCGYSCLSGGPGSAVTAYTNTWALGRVAPGHTVRFQWGLTAVKAGKQVVAFQVAAGLNGKARAVAPDGTMPGGVFRVNITRRPAQAYVTGSGKVVVIRP